MEDAVIVGVCQPFTDSLNKKHGLGNFNAVPLGRAFQRFTRDEYHHEIQHSFDKTGVEDADEIRVIEFRYHSSGGFKRLSESAVLTVWGEDYDRYIAVQRALAGEIDRAEFVGGDQCLEFECGHETGHGRHGGSIESRMVHADGWEMERIFGFRAGLDESTDTGSTKRAVVD